jgi:hypothetical protein
MGFREATPPLRRCFPATSPGARLRFLAFEGGLLRSVHQRNEQHKATPSAPPLPSSAEHFSSLSKLHIEV